MDSYRKQFDTRSHEYLENERKKTIEMEKYQLNNLRDNFDKELATHKWKEQFIDKRY